MATLTNTSKALWKTTEITSIQFLATLKMATCGELKAEGRQKESATERQRLHLMRLLRERKGKKKGGGAEAWKDGVTTMQKTRVNVSGVKACLAESVC